MSNRSLSSRPRRTFASSACGRTRILDVILLCTLPLVLVGVYFLPTGTRGELVLDTANPTVWAAYATHFVHLDWYHLLGNLLIYVPTVAIAFLLCVLSGRRQLFWTMTVTLLLAFPFALSALQLIFPPDRLVLGFSGINAGFAGFACFALAGYIRRTLDLGFEEQYAPALLFLVAAITAVIALPPEAFRLEIATGATALFLFYVVVGLRRLGTPSVGNLQRAAANRGYFEFTGAGFGLLVGYPFVAFQEVVIPGNEVVDVYIHLLGYSLAFILVFVFVFVTERL